MCRFPHEPHVWHFQMRVWPVCNNSIPRRLASQCIAPLPCNHTPQRTPLQLFILSGLRFIFCQRERRWRRGVGTRGGRGGEAGAWRLSLVGVQKPPPAQAQGRVVTHFRSRSMLAAQESMASHSRKSPSGARTAFTIIRSAKDSLLWSRAP